MADLKIPSAPLLRATAIVATTDRFCAAVYVAAVRRYRDEIGSLEWAAPQDWMCELFMPTVRPGAQGLEPDDYHRCVELYHRADVDPAAEPRVCVGSVCWRQASGESEVIVHSIASIGLRLHGFGVKAGGLVRYVDCLESADSLAWSFEARRAAPLGGCLSLARQLRELSAVRGGVAGADAGAAQRDAAAPAGSGGERREAVPAI